MTGWIPVGERLPEVDIGVLVTSEWGVHTARWSGVFWYADEDCGPSINGTVIAWMPLPEPYRG